MAGGEEQAMNNLLFLAYSYPHSSSWTDWIAHRAVSAVIHAVIYGAVFKLMRQMTTGEAIIVAVVVVAALFMWAKSRDRRGW